MNKYVIGCDVGFRFFGLSSFIIRDGKLYFITGKVITTENDKLKKNVRKADMDIENVKKLYTDLTNFLKPYVYNTGQKSAILMACEMPHGGAQGARPNRTMGMATAFITTFIMGNGFDYYSVTPKEGKVALAGSGNATKEEMINAMKKKVFYKNHKYLIDKIKKAELEHFADSIGAVIHTIKYSDIFKLYMREWK